MISHFWFLCLLVSALAQCPPNSIHLEINDTLCYSFHSTLSKFAFAQTHCKSFGAQLVSLKSEYINHYITGFANLVFDDIVFFWTGGNRLHNPNQLEWSNGEKLEYTHFPKGAESKNGSCLTADVKQGFWKVENCFAELSYICEFPAGKNIIPDKADQLDLNGTTDKPDGESDVTLLPPNHTVEFQSTQLSTKIPNDSTPSSPTKITTSTNPKPTVSESTPSESTQAATATAKLPSTSTVTPEEATSNGTPQNLVDNGDCPVGYQHHSETDQCYKLNKEKLMWQDAESFCVKEGGHLTSIENEAENKFIVEFVTKQNSANLCTESDQPWIGFSRLSKGIEYLWIDGSEVNYTNWATLHSQPNNLNGNQKCAEIFTSSTCKFAVGSWNDLNCTLNHTSVCKQPVKGLSTPPPNTQCPLGWEYYNVTNSCYIVNTELTTWEDAEAVCQMEDAHLVSICDEVENIFITELVNLQNSNNTCNTSLQTWIGLSKLADNTSWCWIDGNESNFTKWSKHNQEPNNLHGNQFCVQIITDSGCQFQVGDWNDIECNTTLKAVCKKPAADIVNISEEFYQKIYEDVENATNSHSDSPCSSGWKYNNLTGNCYKVNRKEMNWANAESSCQKEKAHLVSIEDKNENEFVVGLVKNFYDHDKCERVYQLWIGYSRLDDNTSYSWADENSSSNFTNWAHQQPDDRKGKEACAHIITGSKCIFEIGLWNDLSCQNNRYSVCEKSAEFSFDYFNTTPKNDLIIEQLTKL